MSYAVVFSPTAEAELEAISDYLLGEFGIASQRKFYRKLAKTVAQLEIFPNSFLESEAMPGLRKAVVTEYTILFFCIDGHVVEVAAVFDGRRDYEKMEEI